MITEEFNTRRGPLLGIGSINTCQRQGIHAHKLNRLLGTLYLMCSAPWLCRQSESLVFDYKLSRLEFVISLVKLVSSFYSQRKLRFSIEGKISTQKNTFPSCPSHYTVSGNCICMILRNNWCLYVTPF